jgi:hypothetical protein
MSASSYRKCRSRPASGWRYDPKNLIQKLSSKDQERLNKNFPESTYSNAERHRAIVTGCLGPGEDEWDDSGNYMLGIFFLAENGERQIFAKGNVNYLLSQDERIYQSNTTHQIFMPTVRRVGLLLTSSTLEVDITTSSITEEGKLQTKCPTILELLIKARASGISLTTTHVISQSSQWVSLALTVSHIPQGGTFVVGSY